MLIFQEITKIARGPSTPDGVVEPSAVMLNSLGLKCGESITHGLERFRDVVAILNFQEMIRRRDGYMVKRQMFSNQLSLAAMTPDPANPRPKDYNPIKLIMALSDVHPIVRSYVHSTSSIVDTMKLVKSLPESERIKHFFELDQSKEIDDVLDWDSINPVKGSKRRAENLARQVPII